MSATLASLRIRNLALVEDLLWEPGTGFIAITGETGAGKSVVMGAVKLLLGERADKTLIRTGADTCAVEGVFVLPDDSQVHGLLDSGGVEPCEDGRLIVRRVIGATGAGKQFANGSPCTLALLREVGDVLLDLHGPHDHQSLLSRERQLAMLDGFGGANPRKFADARREWIRLSDELRSIRDDAAATVREIDLLVRQSEEIAAAALLPGEEEPLLARRKTAANGRRLAELCGDLAARLGDSDDSIPARVTEAVRAAREIARLDPQGEGIATSAAGIFEAVQELARDLDRYAGSLESDPARLAEIEARLDVIQSLKRKYGTSVDEVIAFGERAAARLAELRGREERGDGLEKEIARAAAAMQSAAAALTKARRAAAPKLQSLVRRHLADLGFAKSGFAIALEPLAEPGPHGCELAEFLFSPNPGEPDRPLRAIASSGEISRVMLALKTALAAQDSVPVLIFDEVDANVGGEIGARVGAKLRELSSSHQVFCITHLPQVAALADAHFIVTKNTAGPRTTTALVEVSGPARESEIARMLGGQASSARAHARALLSG
jgi:DNA repair protein RecN (Recombination protein N)